MHRYSLSHLTKDTLLERGAASARHESTSTATLLAHIAEIDRRRLFADEGYDSMSAFCVAEWGLCEYAAYRRIDAARAARQFPALFEAVAERRLSLTAVNLLAPALTAENAAELIAATTRMTKRQVQELPAERAAKAEGLVRRAIAAPEASCGLLAPALVAPNGASAVGPRDDLAAAPSPAASLAPVVAPAPLRYPPHALLGKAEQEDLDYLKALLGHAVPSGDLTKVLGRIFQAAIRELERGKFAVTSRWRRCRGCDGSSRLEVGPSSELQSRRARREAPRRARPETHGAPAPSLHPPVGFRSTRRRQARQLPCMRLTIFAAFACMALAAAPARAQQVPDSTFDARIQRPAWERGRGPRLRLDQAHHNFHTLDGRYAPFGELARADGFRVSAGETPFTRASLEGLDLLVVANALGSEDMGDSSAMRPAFTDAEIAAVVGWVERGGALLLIADHAPMGSAAAPLGRALGVDMRSAYTLDPARAAAGNPTTVAYSPGAGLDTASAIVRGRAGDPPVRRVVTFTGQSLEGPPGATKLLALSDSAYDAMVTFEQWQSLDTIPAASRKPAAGRAQGLAFERGRGRVVVMGEAAMLTAQLAGPGGRFKVGMNAPGSDDRQFAINVLRWLGRRL